MSRWLVYSIALTIAAAGASLYAYFGLWNHLPDKIPIHWNIRGEADGFVQRDGALSYLLLLPGIMAGVVLLTVTLPWLSPRQFSIDQFRHTYDFLMALIVTMIGYFHIVIIAVSFQLGFDFSRVFLGGLFLFFAAMGNVLGKVQKNFWIGVRTPWTLASDTVWIRTHRLAAWLFVGGGLLAFLAIMIGPVFTGSATAPTIISFVCIGSAGIIPIFYSLWLYKKLQSEGKIPEAELEGGERRASVS
jgi:uncharacterized membrane protein